MAEYDKYDRKTIEELIDGTIDFVKLKEMPSNFKDVDRFDKYISILQERVP
jgi:acetone carboxylase, gamma subunit